MNSIVLTGGIFKPCISSDRIRIINGYKITKLYIYMDNNYIINTCVKIIQWLCQSWWFTSLKAFSYKRFQFNSFYVLIHELHISILAQ